MGVRPEISCRICLMGDRVVVLCLKAVDLGGRNVNIPENTLLQKCIIRREESAAGALRGLGPYVVGFQYAQHTFHAPLYSFLARTSVTDAVTGPQARP